MRYAAWWVRVWSLAAAVGVGLAILEWSAAVTAVTAVVEVAATLLTSVAVTMLTQLRATELGPGWGWRRTLGWSVSGGRVSSLWSRCSRPLRP